MPIDSIKIAIESIDIPDSWITAEEAKEIATSISNQHFADFMSRIMGIVKIASEEGRTSCGVSKWSENNEVVQRAINLLHSLGYEVANEPTSLNIYW